MFRRVDHGHIKEAVGGTLCDDLDLGIWAYETFIAVWTHGLVCITPEWLYLVMSVMLRCDVPIIYSNSRDVPVEDTGFGRGGSAAGRGIRLRVIK